MVENISVAVFRRGGGSDYLGRSFEAGVRGNLDGCLGLGVKMFGWHRFRLGLKLFRLQLSGGG